jgi:hypothetical protein
MILRYLIFFSVLSTMIFSCSRSEPSIVYGSIELVYYGNREKPEERYSFFILPEDEDGEENLSELYLYHDREGLRWLITSKDWIQHDEAGKIWIGSRAIAMTDDEILPRGQYRAVLVNKGGESTERRFTFDAPETPLHPFPLLSIGEGSSYYIDSQYPVNRFICYDQQGTAVQTVLVTAAEGNLRDLRIQGTVRTITLWAEDPEYRVSAVTEAVAAR